MEKPQASQLQTVWERELQFQRRIEQHPDYLLQLLSPWEGGITCHSVISGNWKIYVAVSTLLWWKTHDLYFLVIRAVHQEAPFMYLCSEVNMFGLLDPWTSLPLSVLTHTFFCSNLCPPTAFSHNMSPLLSIPPLLWQALPLALHWNLNSPSPTSTSCYPNIGTSQTSMAVLFKLLSHFCFPP